MIWDWVEGDDLIFKKWRHPVPVSWTQVVSAEGIGSHLHGGTLYVADCEGDVPLHTHLPYISGTSLEEHMLVLASLEDGDRGRLSQNKYRSWCVNWGASNLMARAALTPSR